MNFFLESIRDLDQSLRSLSSRLVVLRGNPTEVLPLVFKRWNVKVLGYESDTEPYCQIRDSQVTALCAEHRVEQVVAYGHTLYDPQSLLSTCKRKVPKTYQAWMKLVEQMGDPEQPIPAPSSDQLPAFDESWLGSEEYAVPESVLHEPFNYSTLPNSPIRGGESHAIQRMHAWLRDEKRFLAFEKPETPPTTFETDPAKTATTLLSPYLKFGCLSPRTFWWAMHRLKTAEEEKANRERRQSRLTQPPVSLFGQLYWREFNYFISWATPITESSQIDCKALKHLQLRGFDRMLTNPLCRVIDWRCVFRAGEVDEKEQQQRQAEQQEELRLFEAWRWGKTGYPAVDAAMTQLREWGWLHHLARHLVACFLTRGDLWCSWERGVQVFDELLIDGDWSLNQFNWLWLSASAFFHQVSCAMIPTASDLSSFCLSLLYQRSIFGCTLQSRSSRRPIPKENTSVTSCLSFATCLTSTFMNHGRPLSTCNARLDVSSARIIHILLLITMLCPSKIWPR